MFQDLHHASSQRRSEVVKDEVGVGFGDCAEGGIGDVVAENDVVEGETGGRPVGEMGDCQGGGGSSVLVQEDEIGKTGGIGAGDEIGEDEVAAVEPNRRGEEKADFFGESGETGGRGAGGCDENAGIGDTAEMGVFVVEVELLLDGEVRL